MQNIMRTRINRLTVRKFFRKIYRDKAGVVHLCRSRRRLNARERVNSDLIPSPPSLVFYPMSRYGKGFPLPRSGKEKEKEKERDEAARVSGRKRAVKNIHFSNYPVHFLSLKYSLPHSYAKNN